MQRLGLFTRLHRRGERGGAAMLVAVLLGGGVIMGFGAITIDVSSLMWERRQVQNGADAAALAMARACAIDPTKCVGSPALNGAGLDALNNGNARDAANGFDTTAYPFGLCGRGNALPACSAGSTADLKQCPTLPASLASNANIPYVEVHTQTKASNGSAILPTWLVRTLVGGSTGTTVKACARAAYGAPGTTVASAPITFSMCEWRANTSNGTSYVTNDPAGIPGYGAAPLPPWPGAATTPTTPGREIIITLQGGPHAPSACYNWQGHDVPGGFGYLSANGCNAAVQQDNWIKIDTGNSSPCDLSPFLGRVIYLPVFDCTITSGSTPTGPPPAVCNAGNGSNTWYHISGWAKFYLSGYKTGGSQQAGSLVSGNFPCNGGDRCISGWFLEGVLRDAPVAGPIAPGSPNYGGYAVQPAG